MIYYLLGFILFIHAIDFYCKKNIILKGVHGIPQSLPIQCASLNAKKPMEKKTQEGKRVPQEKGGEKPITTCSSIQVDFPINQKS